MLYGLACRSQRGPRPGHRCIRVAQEPGRPCGSISTTTGVGQPVPKAPGPRVGVGPGGSDEDRRTGWYCQPKENEGRREGPQGVGTPHSTGETGEPAPREPRGGKEASGQGIVGGKHDGDTVLHSRVHKTPTNSGAGPARRIPAPTSRMPPKEQSFRSRVAFGDRECISGQAADTFPLPARRAFFLIVDETVRALRNGRRAGASTFQAVAGTSL